MVANGDVKTLNDANELYKRTKCDGAMSARGILTNPTLFAGTDVTPLSCLQDWIDIVHANPNVTFQCFHHHLSFMMEKLLKRKQRIEFNEFSNKRQVYDFLHHRFDIVPDESKNGEVIVCEYDESAFRQRSNDHDSEMKRITYDSGSNPGKFFESQLENGEENKENDTSDGGLDFMDSNIFDT